MKASCVVLGALALLASRPAWAQKRPEPEPTVTKEQYEAQQKELEKLRAELDQLKSTTEPKAEARARIRVLQERIETVQRRELARQRWLRTQEEHLRLVNQRLRKAEAEIRAQSPGTTKLVLAGDMSGSFVYPRHGSSTFGVGFSPLFLWELDPRILVEAGLDMALTNDPNGDNPSTDLDLALINLSYIINDYLLVGAGRFATPFGFYHTHLDPGWIDKLPDDPLPFGDGGIAADTSVGVFATGAVPIGPVLLNYGAYVDNGPTLIIDDPVAAGSLSFENFVDPNKNKAVGGRVGFVPFPELEVGYAIQYARVNPPGFETVHSLLQAVDLNYVQILGWLAGRVTVGGSWVWSRVDRATYDPGGSLGFGPLRFSNRRNGGYGQIAYRPSRLGIPVVPNLEAVFRYDRLDVPAAAPGGGLDQRYSPGLLYWFTPSTVLKASYDFDNNDAGPDQDMLLVQLAAGM